MARSFLDTRALVKYSHPEEGTVAVTQFVQERNARHDVSRLGIVEAQHAFAIKLRPGEITETDFEGLRQRLLRDIAQGQFQHVRVTEPHYREAERLIVAYRRGVSSEGSRLRCDERRPRMDPEKRILYPELIYRRYQGDLWVDEAVLKIPRRCYSPAEFEQVIIRHGFRIVQRWGEYAGEPYGEGPELVIEFAASS